MFSSQRILIMTLACLLSAGSLPAASQSTPLSAPAQLGPTGSTESIDRGWEGLARVLRSMSPSVDTSIPPTGAEITARIEGLLKAGRFEQALKEIDQRLSVETQRATPGTDVQLLFLQAYTYAALGRLPEAEAIYKRMTIRFPELAEPWNNLAAIYVQRGDLEQARGALETAIMINPAYKSALSNLGDVQLMIAMKAYQRAAGTPGDAMPELARKIQAVRQVLDGKLEPAKAGSSPSKTSQPAPSNPNKATLSK